MNKKKRPDWSALKKDKITCKLLQHVHGGCVSGAAWNQRAGNHHNHVAFTRQAALQRQLFTQVVEIISRGDLFHQLRYYAFAQD